MYLAFSCDDLKFYTQFIFVYAYINIYIYIYVNILIWVYKCVCVYLYTHICSLCKTI